MSSLTNSDVNTPFGNFEGCRPSDLFLKIFSNVAAALQRNPKGNIVEPCYTGSTGSIPLTILSNMPDIIQHYCQLIVEARQEVLLATNAWKNSESVKAIGSALRELSRRTQARGGGVIVTVKIMFLMLSPKLLLRTHVHVKDPELASAKIGLPGPDELPGIHLQVVNYHNLPLGTLHSKFLVIDGRIAVIGSNNIQDNGNLEMSCDFQGPIVQGIRRVFIESWNPLEEDALVNVSKSPPEEPAGRRPTDGDWEIYVSAISERWNPRGLESQMDAVTRALSETPPDSTYSEHVKGDAEILDIQQRPFIPCMMTGSERVPIALVNRNHSAGLFDVVTSPEHKHPVPQNEAWLAAVGLAKETVFIQSPDFNSGPIVQAVLAAARRRVEVTLYLTAGYNDAGEMVPSQGGHNDKIVAQMFRGLETEYKQYLKVYWYVGRDMRKPLHATARCRNSHVKLMIVDNQIGIMGSGNQDTQSWAHSQEINVMIDSVFVCGKWMEMVMHNQNTHLYGRIDPQDGVWKGDSHKDASKLEGAYGPDAGLKEFVKAAYLTVKGVAK